LSADEAGGGAGEDLVVVALPSVQRFIGEARTTSDVASASAIYSELAGRVVRGLGESAGRLVLLAASLEDGPGDSGAGMPNRVVALLPAGTGVQAARAAGEAVYARWRAMVEETFREPGHGTPGSPVVQWVCVPPVAGGYAAQWARAQRLLAARRRTRDFAPLPEGGWRQRDICSLSPWPATACGQRNAMPATGAPARPASPARRRCGLTGARRPRPGRC
jgi:CRISPR-associated protein Cmr2